jgi:hypothetical protein
VHNPSVPIQIICSVSMTVTIATITSWNKVFMISLRLISHKELSQLSCHVDVPDYRKLTHRLASSY